MGELVGAYRVALQPRRQAVARVQQGQANYRTRARRSPAALRHLAQDVSGWRRHLARIRGERVQGRVRAIFAVVAGVFSRTFASARISPLISDLSNHEYSGGKIFSPNYT